MLSRSARVAVLTAAPLVLASLLAGCGGGSGTALPSAAANSQRGSFDQPATQLRGGIADMSFADQLKSGLIRPVCDRHVPRGTPVCFSYILNDKSLAPHAQGHPDVSGYGPADLQAAYNLGSVIGNPGGTVALVLWYNDPNLDADLAVYRKNFGLPPCTKANGCLMQVNQDGGSKHLPKDDPGAAIEESLDVDMVSANCPNCKIIYVEAAGPYNKPLITAENTAASLAGVVAISNSWGSPGYEDPYFKFRDAFNHPGQAVVASAGDSGYLVSGPADYNTLTAAVGTTLSKGGSGRGWTETVWSGTGSGCSKIIKPRSWQLKLVKKDKLTGCTNRVIGDIAYDANPGTGVAVYDTYGYGGWIVVGGTSVSAPAEAGLYALSGNTTGVPSALAYANLSSFYDITSGQNGTCTPAWLCTAEVGFDAPTGVGSPNGIGGF
jgi:subtilase family serine protease